MCMYIYIYIGINCRVRGLAFRVVVARSFALNPNLSSLAFRALGFRALGSNTETLHTALIKTGCNDWNKEPSE